ncbi:MAG: Tn3 family transposase, partial [Acidobacteria bacterium]|nr:Tn3 family transposase [Acidobacteriota bacterium]
MVRSRQRGPALPEDPTEEELARDWTLLEADRVQVLRCRGGEDNRRRFALQLCTLRQYGRFLVDYTSVPVRILNHIGRQLDLAPAFSVPEPERSATETAHQQRIRDYLRYRTFDQEARGRLEEHLRTQLAQGRLHQDLLTSAEEALLFWKVLLPPQSTLGRLVASVAATGRQEILERIAARISDPARKAFDELLKVAPGERRSSLFLFKQYPPEAKPASILDYLERYQLLQSAGVSQIDLSGILLPVIDHLSQLTRKYDVQALKRFAPETRHAMLACFLVEAQKTLLDHLVAMHDQFVTGMSRRGRNAFEQRHRQFRRRAKRGIETLLSAIEILLSRADTDPVAELYRSIEETTLRAALEDCREFQRLEEHGYQDELRSRYPHLRRYLPAFLTLPFSAEPGMEPLMTAIKLARELDQEGGKKLPMDAPVEFVPSVWRGSLQRDGDRPDRRLWDIALALAVRDALRSGDLFLPQSRHHVSFANLIYDERQWARERTGAYEQLSLFQEEDEVIAHLVEEFEEVARRAERSMDANAFASVSDGRLKLKRRDALPISPQVVDLHRLIETSLPPVRIEDLLRHVDSHSHFTREFRPLGGYEPHAKQIYPTLLAALIAHGTNLGIAAMGQSAQGITVDMLQHVTRWFLREETLKAANAALVNFHHQLPISRVWGPGLASSSDGQRFGIQQSSLLASFYPRYFGYYERAVTVYTHTSDQYSVFGTRVISCSPREALYVLDGLLENNTVLRLREHYTDTHGFTEHIFGLSYLLGYSFMPRLRDLADQRLYKPEREVNYGCLNPLFRATVDKELIRERWDQLVRVAASLRKRTAPANVIIQRLANSSPSDRLAKALTALGRAVKTIYILRYLSDAELRYRVQLQLNRGESRHSLVTRCLFFANRGEFRTGDAEEIMNKASCLSLLSNAVLVWNTMRIADIVDQLRCTGQEVSERDLAHVSPLMHGHV